MSPEFICTAYFVRDILWNQILKKLQFLQFFDQIDMLSTLHTRWLPAVCYLHHITLLSLSLRMRRSSKSTLIAENFIFFFFTKLWPTISALSHSCGNDWRLFAYLIWLHNRSQNKVMHLNSNSWSTNWALGVRCNLILATKLCVADSAFVFPPHYFWTINKPNNK